MIWAVFLASGHSRRFGADKLLHEVDGLPMAARAFAALPAGMPGIVVTRSDAVEALAAQYPNLKTVHCPPEKDDVALTIRLGLEALPAEAEGAMFLVCDQPRLSRRSVMRLAMCFARAPERIWVLSHGRRWGNPCVFPKCFFDELRHLPENRPGKYLIRRHEDRVSLCQTLAPEELEDMDRPQ